MPALLQRIGYFLCLWSFGKEIWKEDGRETEGMLAKTFLIWGEDNDNVEFHAAGHLGKHLWGQMEEDREGKIAGLTIRWVKLLSTIERSLGLGKRAYFSVSSHPPSSHSCSISSGLHLAWAAWWGKVYAWGVVGSGCWHGTWEVAVASIHMRPCCWWLMKVGPQQISPEHDLVSQRTDSLLAPEGKEHKRGEKKNNSCSAVWEPHATLWLQYFPSRLTFLMALTDLFSSIQWLM